MGSPPLRAVIWGAVMRRAASGFWADMSLKVLELFDRAGEGESEGQGGQYGRHPDRFPVQRQAGGKEVQRSDVGQPRGEQVLGMRGDGVQPPGETRSEDLGDQNQPA